MLTPLLKRLLFRPATASARLQRLWSRLHTLSLFGMHYGGGAAIESSGEAWFLERVAGDLLKHQEAPVVFDVGAHTGEYSLVARRVIPRARVFAFEPSPETYRRLVDELARQSVSDITTVELGFSDVEGVGELHAYTVDGTLDPRLSSLAVRRPTQDLDIRLVSAQTVRVSTIDAFCQQNGIRAIGLLKLDVEGHERSVLEGARQMLAADAISVIQFEFGYANIYTRTFFFDFWSLLSPRFDIFRLVPVGLAPIRHYGSHLEIFLTTNYVAIMKSEERSFDPTRYHG